MKAVLEFNLPESQERFEASAKGLEWKSVVAELDSQINSWIKERKHFATPAKAFRVCDNSFTSVWQRMVSRWFEVLTEIVVHEARN